MKLLHKNFFKGVHTKTLKLGNVSSFQFFSQKRNYWPPHSIIELSSLPEKAGMNILIEPFLELEKITSKKKRFLLFIF